MKKTKLIIKIVITIALITMVGVFCLRIIIAKELGYMMDIHTTDYMGKYDEVRVYTDEYLNDCTILYFVDNDMHDEVENVGFYYQYKQYVYIIDMDEKFYIIDLENEIMIAEQSCEEDLKFEHKKNVENRRDLFIDVRYVYD